MKNNQEKEEEKEEEEVFDKYKDLKYEGIERATNNQMIDDFFSFNLKPRSRKVKPLALRTVLKTSTKVESPKKRDFKGTDYIQKYKSELKEVSCSDTCSSINFSHISGPSNYSKSFFEDEDYELPHNSYFHTFRVNLPIYQYRDEIISNVREHSVSIIRGSTGCGKSTQVPQYIYEDCTKRREQCNILVSQPRKIAAITIAQRVALERGVTVGEEIGYQVALNKLTCESEDVSTAITYCTTGVILAKLIQRKNMNAFSHIILDEVHERNVDTDLLIAIIRQFLSLNSPHTKIILMSATMDSNQLLDFFKIPTQDDFWMIPPIVNIGDGTRRFPIEIKYLEEIEKLGRERGKDIINYEKPSISDYMYQLAVRFVSLLVYPAVAKEASRDITVLVFLPGIQEIETFKRLLSAEDKVGPKDQVIVHILHSMLSTEDQKKAFATGTGSRVILSTNISESSVTIPNVTYVVDFCLTKYNGFVAGSHMSSLITEWASQNNCTQRAGRTGRVKQGSVYRLVHQKFYEKKMKKFPKPEILRIPLETVILKVKKLDMGPPCKILAVSLDPPDYSQIVDAVLKLKEHGGLLRTNTEGVFEFDDGELTYLGECMASLPCDVRISKLIMVGYLMSVLDEAIIIGAGLSIQGIFKWQSDDKMITYNVKAKYAKDSESDLIAILNAYSKFKDLRDNSYFNNEMNERRWCSDNGLDYKNLHEMRLWIEEITKRLFQLNIKTLPGGHQPQWNNSEKIFILKIVFAAAFGVANYFLPSSGQVIDRETASTLNNLNPNKTVYFKNMNRNLFGCIYEDQIIKTLIREGVCDNKSKVSVSFDHNRSERVFVTFEGNPSDSYEHVPPEMYRAAKLRRLKNGIALQVMDENKTFEYAQKQDLLEEDEITGRFVEKKALLKHPEWCPLPTCFADEMQGIVTKVISSQKFFFRPYVATGYNLPKDLRYRDTINEIKRIMKLAKIKTISGLTKKKLADDFVIVDRNTGELERGSFIEYINLQDAKVHLIDSNINFSMSVLDIYEFVDKNDPDLMKLMAYPPRIIECRLKEIQPAFVKSFENGWSEEGTNQFRDAVEDNRVKIKIYSIIDDIVNVDLYMKDKDGVEFCWNDKLIANGYAEACDESYQSSMAHENRIQRAQNYQTAHGPEVEFAKKIDLKKSKKYIKSPPTYACPIRMRLAGPVTPLEVQLRGISFNQRRFVSIDGSSINQILLNNTFNNFSNKFCVASDVYFSNDNQQIKLRETTMLPNVTGLAVILALIFSPVAQIRRNKEKTRFASIITGLGADDKNTPYFMDRDCALEINFELKEDDIAAVNHLRLSMSHLFYSDPMTKGRLVNLMDSQREVTLRKIKKQIIDIVNKPRIISSSSETNVNFLWNVDQGEAIEPLNMQGHRAIFNMISFSKLQKMTQEHKKKLLAHVKDLELCARCSKAPDCRECKLCNEYIDNCHDLKMHLLTKKHINIKAHILEMNET